LTAYLYLKKNQEAIMKINVLIVLLFASTVIFAQQNERWLILEDFLGKKFDQLEQQIQQQNNTIQELNNTIQTQNTTIQQLQQIILQLQTQITNNKIDIQDRLPTTNQLSIQKNTESNAITEINKQENILTDIESKTNTTLDITTQYKTNLKNPDTYVRIYTILQIYHDKTADKKQLLTPLLQDKDEDIQILVQKILQEGT